MNIIEIDDIEKLIEIINHKPIINIYCEEDIPNKLIPINRMTTFGHLIFRRLIRSKDPIYVMRSSLDKVFQTFEDIGKGGEYKGTIYVIDDVLLNLLPEDKVIRVQPPKEIKPYFEPEVTVNTPISTNSFIEHTDKILDHLYLGDKDSYVNIDKFNIKGILNVSDVEPSIYLNPEIVYEQFKIDDTTTASQILYENLDKYVNYIHEFVRNGNNFLVHCYDGISRSASIVIAYVMKFKNLDLSSAIEYVTKRRFIVDPNIGFIETLERYNEYLIIKRKEYIDKLFSIRERVSHMNSKIITQIYSTLDKGVEYIKMCPVCNIGSNNLYRKIMYVSKLKYTDSPNEIDINQYFYQSSGTSRGDIKLSGHWIPGGEFSDKPSKIIPKYAEENVFLEVFNTIESSEKNLIYINNISIFDTDNILEIPEVFYSRYVTKKNAYVDLHMQKFDRQSIEDIFINVQSIEFVPFMTIKSTNITKYLEHCQSEGFYKL